MFEETACLRQNQEAQAVALSLKQRLGYKPPSSRETPRRSAASLDFDGAQTVYLGSVLTVESVRARQDLGTTILQKSY
jgi:hypothetical protein